MATHVKGGWKWFEDRQGTLACAEEKVRSWECAWKPLLKTRVGLLAGLKVAGWEARRGRLTHLPELESKWTGVAIGKPLTGIR